MHIHMHAQICASSNSIIYTNSRFSTFSQATTSSKKNGHDLQWASSALLSHYSTTSTSHGYHSNESRHPRRTDIIHEWRFGALPSHDSTTSTSHVPYQRHGSHVNEVMYIMRMRWYTCVTWDMCDVSRRQVPHVKLYSPISHHFSAGKALSF